MLDARNDFLRTQETNIFLSLLASSSLLFYFNRSQLDIGNLIADIMREELRTDVAFINGGSIRSNNTYGPGA